MFVGELLPLATHDQQLRVGEERLDGIAGCRQAHRREVRLRFVGPQPAPDVLCVQVIERDVVDVRGRHADLGKVLSHGLIALDDD